MNVINVNHFYSYLRVGSFLFSSHPSPPHSLHRAFTPLNNILNVVAELIKDPNGSQRPERLARSAASLAKASAEGGRGNHHFFMSK